MQVYRRQKLHGVDMSLVNSKELTEAIEKYTKQAIESDILKKKVLDLEGELFDLRRKENEIVERIEKRLDETEEETKG